MKLQIITTSLSLMILTSASPITMPPSNNTTTSPANELDPSSSALLNETFSSNQMSFQDENGVQDFTSYNENSDPIDSDQLVFVPEIIKGSLTYNQYMQQHESEKIRDEASREGSGRLEAVLDGAGDQGISASLNNMNPAAVDSTGDQGISVNSPLNNMQPGAVDTTGGQGISPVDTTGDQGISSADTTGDQGISPSADNLSTDGSSTPNVVHDSNLQDNQGIPTSFVTQDTENFDQVTIPLEESTGSAGTNEAPLEEAIPNVDNPEDSIDDQTPISDSIDSSANVDESQVDANGSMGIPRHEYVLEGDDDVLEEEPLKDPFEDAQNQAYIADDPDSYPLTPDVETYPQEFSPDSEEDGPHARLAESSGNMMNISMLAILASVFVAFL